LADLDQVVCSQMGFDGGILQTLSWENWMSYKSSR